MLFASFRMVFLPTHLTIKDGVFQGRFPCAHALRLFPNHHRGFSTGQIPAGSMGAPILGHSEMQGQSHNEAREQAECLRPRSHP